MRVVGLNLLLGSLGVASFIVLQRSPYVGRLFAL